MNLRIAPKSRALAYACAVLGGVVLALWIAPGVRVPEQVGVAEIVPVKDGEVLKAERAASELKRLSASMKERRWSDTELASTSQYFPTRPKEVVVIDQESVSSLVPSKLALLISQMKGPPRVYMEGKRIRMGEPLQGGIVLKETGKTFIVLEDSAGLTRRIDIADSFTSNEKSSLSGKAKR